MNYFAHGRAFLDDPYVLAGTAVPDWLSVVNRRIRTRGKRAELFLQDQDPRVAAIARGIVRHHRDDQWFHQTRAFAELSLQLTREIRELLSPDDSFRPSFLGHILVELLLDAALIAEEPERLDDYYQAVDAIDPYVVAEAVNRIATRPTGMLAFFIERFSAERFLYDYAEDAKLLVRLNHVMRRVGLPDLPPSFTSLLPSARAAIRARQWELLAEETST